MGKYKYLILAIVLFNAIVIWYFRPDRTITRSDNSAASEVTNADQSARSDSNLQHHFAAGRQSIDNIQGHYIKNCEGKPKTCESEFWTDLSKYWNVDEATAKVWFKEVQEHEQSLNNVSINSSDMNVRFQTFWDLHVKALGQEKAEKIYGKQKALFDFDNQTEEIWKNPQITNADQRVKQWEQMQQDTLGKFGSEFTESIDQDKLYQIEVALREKDGSITESEKQKIRMKYFP